MNTAEKIETIALARKSGTMGTFFEFAPGKYRIVADGLVVLVRRSEIGWHVSFKGIEGIDRELYPAAKLALNEGAVNQVSRNFCLSDWE